MQKLTRLCLRMEFGNVKNKTLQGYKKILIGHHVHTLGFLPLPIYIVCQYIRKLTRTYLLQSILYVLLLFFFLIYYKILRIVQKQTTDALKKSVVAGGL